MYVCPVPCCALEPSGEGAWVSGDVPCRRLLQLQLQLQSPTSPRGAGRDADLVAGRDGGFRHAHVPGSTPLARVY